MTYLYIDTKGNATKWSPWYFWSRLHTVNSYHLTCITLTAAMVKTLKTIHMKSCCKAVNLNINPWLFFLVFLYRSSSFFLKIFYLYSITKSTWILPLNMNISKLDKREHFLSFRLWYLHHSVVQSQNVVVILDSYPGFTPQILSINKN